MIVQFPPRLSIGRLIREERIKHNHKQGWAASQCGYSIRQWIYWEQCMYIPSDRALNSICRLYPTLQNCTKLHSD